jgi:RimJ/RimL family protein N-acetyltransferase
MRMESDRLILRGYEKKDFDSVHSYGSLTTFSQYEPWGPNTIEDTQRFISDMILQASTKPRYKFDLALELKESGRMIGGAGIRRESQDSVIANLGWAVHPDFQGQGLATEAARRLIQFGFEELKLKVIYATCDARNQASFRVMEKLGMKRVGLLIGDKKQKGHLRDTLRYEILPG